jgi:hypothetical protein
MSLMRHCIQQHGWQVSRYVTASLAPPKVCTVSKCATDYGSLQPSTARATQRQRCVLCAAGLTQTSQDTICTASRPRLRQCTQKQAAHRPRWPGQPISAAGKLPAPYICHCAACNRCHTATCTQGSAILYWAARKDWGTTRTTQMMPTEEKPFKHC